MGRRDLQKSIRREFCSWRIRTRVGIGREFSDFEQANGRFETETERCSHGRISVLISRGSSRPK